MDAYGIAASRKGYNVDQGADHQMSFRSEFPTLKIHQTISFSTPANWSGGDLIVVDHNLGYIPAHILWRTGQGTVNQIQADWQANFLMTATQFIVKPNDAIANRTFRLFIFREPVGVTFQAAIVDTDVAPQLASAAYGIRTSKEGSDTLAVTDPRQIAFSTEMRNPFVHKTGFVQGKDVAHTVPHGLGYPPLFLLFASDFIFGLGTAAYHQIMYNFYAESSNESLFITPTSNARYAYMILKDPLL
jgi:hypothetical protein